MALPSVTIVIPTRNRAPLLESALRSLIDQDYPTELYEIVVVDDGSTDTTSRMVATISTEPQGPIVRLVRQPPKNQSAARNRGFHEANGTLIAFFDDDEVAPKRWLLTLAEASYRYPDADCFGGPYRLQFEGRPPRLCKECWPGEGHNDFGDSERSVEWVAGGNMIVRPRAFERAGRFNESVTYGEEREWLRRVWAAGGSVVYIPRAWVTHRRTPDMLRLGSRLRKAFLTGSNDARSVVALGRPSHGVHRLGTVPWPLAHAITRRCSNGLTQAAMSLGFGLEALVLSWSNRRTSCPRRPT